MTHRPSSRPLARILPVLLGFVTLAGGCSTPPPPDLGTSLVRLRDPALPIPQRVDAADEAVEAADAGIIGGTEVWNSLKDLGWSENTPSALRRRSVELLVTEGVVADPESVRAFVRLRLPTESDRAVVAMLSVAASDNGWTEATTALARRLAVPDSEVDPNRRVEAAALLALHPNRSLEATVFDVFLNPDTPAADDRDRWRAAVRGELWELLGRLDRDASVRARLLSNEPGVDLPVDARPVLACLRRGVRDLGVVPDTAAELAWLERLCDSSDTNASWWAEVSSVVDSVPLGRRLGVGLRHLEPMRWAAAHRPRWLQATRDELLLELRGSLAERRHEYRTAQMGPASRARSRERLEDWEDRLRWGDVLALLVVDASLGEPALFGQVFRFVELDRGDEGTEYGGIIEALDTVAPGSPGLIGLDPSGGAFRAVLFPPRSRDRGNDEVFVASFDMIRQSDRALLHFHQQVQRVNNDRFAGPSEGDLAYARRSGRTCLVFTSVGDDELNVDVYQPNGVVVDLGTFERPEAGARVSMGSGW